MGLFGREDVDFRPPLAGRLGQLRNVARNKEPLLRLRKRRTQDGADMANRLPLEPLGELRGDQPLLNGLRGQLVEGDVANRWDDVRRHLLFIEHVRPRPTARFHAVFEPALEKLREQLLPCVRRQAERVNFAGLFELIEYRFARRAVERRASATEHHLPTPATFRRPPCDATFLISSPGHRTSFLSAQAALSVLFLIHSANALLGTRTDRPMRTTGRIPVAIIM